METLNLALFSIPQESVKNSLEKIFNPLLIEQHEVTTTTKTRRILDETAIDLSDEQIECVVTNFQFLINSWLDEFEKETFSGKTLKEVLNEK